VLVKSTAAFHHARPTVRGLVLKALLDRKLEDVVLAGEDFSYDGRAPDRGVIQVDLF